MTGARLAEARGAWRLLLLVGAVHLALSWPGAGTRGVISEEALPYLRQYPKVLGDAGDAVRYLPPNDDAAFLAGVEARKPVPPRWVGTREWPELAYHDGTRVLPVFVRAHQTALGTWWGILVGPGLGGGIAGVRRSSVLLELALLWLTWGLGRRLGLTRGWATVAALGGALSPGLWFFGRTGYGFELASRVAMMGALFVAAPRGPPGRLRAALTGVGFAVAVLCRATIAATLAPMLALMLLDPRRGPRVGRVATTFALGALSPLGLVAAATITLPFAEAPGAALPLGELGARTLLAPQTARMQLAWLADPRVVLAPLLEGGAVSIPLGPTLLAGAVAGLAVARFWRGRAGESERLLFCGAVANALAGAWLYGDPAQFQLGMALEPIFALAVATQLAALCVDHRRVAVALAGALLSLRAFTLASLWRSELRTDNPMLSGRAQRELVDVLAHEHVAGDALVTTAYDHVGVLESWTGEALRPVHAWRLLRAPESEDPEELERAWGRILDARAACRVLLSIGANLESGKFTDGPAVARALERAVTRRGGAITDRRALRGDGGGVVFELLTLAPCDGAAAGSP